MRAPLKAQLVDTKDHKADMEDELNKLVEDMAMELSRIATNKVGRDKCHR